MSKSADLRLDIAAAALTSAHFSVRTAMPVLLEVLAIGYGFSDGQIGALGSAYNIGATLIALTSVMRMRGMLLQLPTVLLLALGTIALTSVALTRSYVAVIAAFTLAGIGYGGVYALMMVTLSRTANPDRAFGFQWGLGSLPGIALLYIIPASVYLKDAVHPAIVAIVATNLLCGIAAFLLPDRLMPARHLIERTQRVGSAADRVGGVTIALIGLCAFYLGITGAWSFLGRVAIEAGLTTKYAGAVLAIGTAASSAAALIAGSISEIGGRRTSMATAIAAMLAGLALLGLWPTRLGFAIGTIVFIGLATFVLTFGSGIIARLDTGGRASGLAAAALGAGSILGPGIAGQLSQAAGAETMLLACGVSLVVGLIAYVNASRLVGRPPLLLLK